MTTRYSSRPAKPYPEFPLFAHNSRQWCRKIRGKICSFGPWDDWQAALERHNQEYPYLKAGMLPPGSLKGITVKELCDRFLESKEGELAAGQICERWFAELHTIGQWIADQFGRHRLVESLRPDDFHKVRLALVGKYSPTIAKNRISRIKSFFKFGYENQLIEKPVLFGPQFRPPSRALIRKHRAGQVKKVWQPKQIRAMLKRGNSRMRAMILLGINGGLNNADICKLPIRAVNFKNGWLDYPRSKTWVPRRVKLWPETLQAIRDYMAERRDPIIKDHRELLFITAQLNPWTSDAVVLEFQKLLTKCGIENGSFIWFRKTVQTIGENAGDLIAVKLIMGHVDDSISDHYREDVDPARIVKVTDHLRGWLFGKAKPNKARKSGKRGAA